MTEKDIQFCIKRLNERFEQASQSTCNEPAQAIQIACAMMTEIDRILTAVEGTMSCARQRELAERARVLRNTIMRPYTDLSVLGCRIEGLRDTDLESRVEKKPKRHPWDPAAYKMFDKYKALLMEEVNASMKENLAALDKINSKAHRKFFDLRSAWLLAIEDPDLREDITKACDHFADTMQEIVNWKESAKKRWGHEN